MTTEFIEIYRNNSEGTLRIASTGLAWQDAQQKDSIITIASSNVRYGTITRAARGFQLRLDLKKGDDRETFDGIKREDTDRLVHLFSTHFGTLLHNKELSLRGWNWGRAELQGQDLTFLVAGKPAFDVPVAHVHNTSINKTEVAIEFLQPEATTGKKRQAGDVDELIEMRLYIPGSAAAARKREAKVKQEGQNGAKEDSESEEPSDVDGGDAQTAAQTFHDEVKEKAEVGHVAGESLITFNEVHCTTPRGRYDIDLFPTFFRLRSKSYDYKILFTSVVKLFLLPRTDDINVILVANLDPPIRQGQTRYPYLVMQFSRDEDMEAEINLTDEALESYRSRNINLEKRYEAPAFEVVSAVFRQLTGKKPIVPNGMFQSNDGQTAVKCNLKANEGHLYPLEKYMLYIAKQPLLVPYNELHQVKFERMSGVMGSSRTFDLRLVMRSGDEHVFSSLGKDEHQPLWDFLKERHVSVKNEMHDEMVATQSAISAALKAANESDSEMSEEEPSPRRKRGADEDSEDEEVDDDFKAASDQSDVAEEFDENYSSDSDQPASRGAKSGASASGSEDDDDDDDASMDVDEAPKKGGKRAADNEKGGVSKKAKP